MKRSLLVSILMAIALCCNSATERYCAADNINFRPPDWFYLVEGPVSLEQRGYIRGMTTDRSWPTSALVPTGNETVPPSCGGTATNMKWQSTKV